MAIDFPKLKVYDIGVQQIFCLVAIFKITELTPAQKSSLVCSLFCIPYSLEGLEPYLYLSIPAPTFLSPIQLFKSWDERPNLL